jgi:hypothetical protein
MTLWASSKIPSHSPCTTEWTARRSPAGVFRSIRFTPTRYSVSSLASCRFNMSLLVGSLLNPCNCPIGSICKCQALAGPPAHENSSLASAVSSQYPSGLLLAPIRVSSQSPVSTPTVPTFAIRLPPMRVMKSLAGSGCTCGVDCTCPGCVEHCGPVQAAASGRRSCADGCGTCVDRQSDIVLTHPPGTHTSSIDLFFARAAALPAPPTNLREVVNLPKLKCCGGQCGCPDGNCGCGSSCDGCCEDHARDAVHGQQKDAPPVSFPRRKRTCCGA